MGKHRVDIAVLTKDQASKALGRITKSTLALNGALQSVVATAATFIGARQLAELGRFGASFEMTMSRVGALTDATDEQMKELTDTARDLGTVTVFTGKQAAQGMSFMALAGFEVNEIMTAMPSILDLAAAGQLDVAESADIAAKIMRGMGLGAEDLTETVDVLAKAFTSANTDLSQLGESMGFVGPIGRLAGIELAELTAVLQTLSDAGIQASRAGTSTRQMIGTLTGSTPAATQKMRQLGIATMDTAGNLLPIADIVDSFNEALEGMGKAEKTGRILQIFGKRAGPGMAALLSEGSDSLRQLQSELEGAEGTARKIAQRQLDNVAGEMIRIKSLAGSFIIDIFLAAADTLKDYLIKFREGFTVAGAIVKSFGEIAELVQTQYALNLVRIVSHVQNFANNTIELAKWLKDNWRELFTDMFNFTVTVFKNMGENIFNFF